MIILRNINAELSNITSRFDFNGVLEQTFDAQRKLAATISSNLGKNVNEVIGGFQALTQELDDGDVPTIVNRGIALLVDDPPGMKIKQQITELKSDIEALTESAAADGFLKFVVTANTPAAMTSALQRVTGDPLETIINAVSTTVPQLPEIAGKLPGALQELQSGLTAATQLMSQVANFERQLTNAIDQGLSGVVNNVAERVVGNYAQAVNNIVGTVNLPFDIDRQIRSLVQNSELAQAAQTLSRFSTLSTTAITTTLAAIPTTLSQITAGNINQLTQNIRTINPTTTNAPAGAPSAVADTVYVGSDIEIQAILASAQREITTVVVGSSKTFTDQDVRPSDVPEWHFLITRTGDLQPVLPIDTVGSYTPSFNNNTIGIVFAGGTGTTAKEGAGRNVETLTTSRDYTRRQWNTFDLFMKMFYTLFPYGQAVGLNDVTANTSSPGFNVKQYVKSRFNKTTIVDVNRPAPSLRELQALMEIVAAGYSTIPETLDEPVEIPRVGPQ